MDHLGGLFVCFRIFFVVLIIIIIIVFIPAIVEIIVPPLIRQFVTPCINSVSVTMVVYKQGGLFSPIQVHSVNKNHLLRPGLCQIKSGHLVFILTW